MDASISIDREIPKNGYIIRFNYRERVVFIPVRVGIYLIVFTYAPMQILTYTIVPLYSFGANTGHPDTR